LSGAAEGAPRDMARPAPCAESNVALAEQFAATLEQNRENQTTQGAGALTPNRGP
jgi:hypothetical protein